MAFDDLSQDINYDDEKKIFIFGVHGSYCNQSGHIPCFYEGRLDETNSNLIKPFKLREVITE